MVSSSDIFLRALLVLVGIVFLRDRYAGLRGTELWLQGKGREWHIFSGTKSQIVGAFLIVLGLTCLAGAWFGWQ